ncbi:MAG: nucleoside recognition domain-containing protein [Melioribacteraceae bacterium]|nr:MAG: nucleoside recognition domain-containing protein [Melioribacteraceae bacterium]
MLNYIWLALLFLGIATALTTDIIDESKNKYQNGNSIPVEIFLDELSESHSQQQKAQLKIPHNTFNEFYNTSLNDTISHSIQLSYNEKKGSYSLFLRVNESSPEIWQTMAAAVGKSDDLLGTLEITNSISSKRKSGSVEFETVSFIHMKEVTNSTLDYASTAVNIALGLIGIMALWLGIMKIAEEAGLINIIAKAVKPITRFLFPTVPHDHPAIGSIIMNLSANMLGLGNAATPFGLKAMEQLDELNENKGTATNAMCMFLAVNTAGLTLIPATAIAVRAAAGSSDPTIIIGTSFFGALCATIVGITSAKIFETFSQKNIVFKQWLVEKRKPIIFVSLIILLAVLISITGLLTSILNNIEADVFKSIIQIVSTLAIPFIILLFVTYGIFKKVKIYESFVEGAKEGFQIAVRIIPYLVAMLVAIGIFRAGGAMEYLIALVTPATDLIGMPAEALPMAFMRPLSGSGALGIMAEIISVHGADSFIGVLVSTIMGSTETTFYVIAVYFGAVNISRTRYALTAGLLADLAGILGALFIVKFLFG